MGSSGLPRVPTVPERSKVSKFPKDPKLSKIFRIPKMSKVLLHLQSFKVLHSSCLSSFPGSTGIAILQCFQLMLFSGYSTKGSSKGSSRNSRKALRKDNYFLTSRRTFEFSWLSNKHWHINSPILCIPYQWVSDGSYKKPHIRSTVSCDVDRP